MTPLRATPLHEGSARRPRRRPRSHAWTFAGIAISGLLGLTILGAVYQHPAIARDRVELDPPGRLVDVDGNDLHLHCTGDGAPTVLLEAGNIAYSVTWAWVQASLSNTTRVCSYDCAGLAWSEHSNEPRDGRTSARELKQLLDNAGENPGFVLVGHSLGGMYVRSFAVEFPGDVAALVLVDPSHPDQFERMSPAMRGQHRWGMRVMSGAPALARIGALRITNAFGRLGSALPAWEYRTARLFLSSPTHLRTARAELEAFDETGGQLRKTRLRDNLPVSVLSATETGGSAEIAEFLATLHAELASLTSRTRHMWIDGADHYTIVTHSHHAARVAGHVEELVLSSRSFE